MDKKTVIQMIRGDLDNFLKESDEISKTINGMKNDANKYIQDLLAQISQTGSAPLLAKTPKLNRKRGTRIKAIPESDEFETTDSTMSNSISSTRSRADTMVLETSDVRPTRAKRGASVRATDNIKKQQSINLASKLRRPSSEEAGAYSINKTVKESQSKRPKISLESSDEEEIRPSKLMKMDKKKKEAQTMNKINDETHDIINESTHLPPEDQTFTLMRSSKSSLKRKFDEKNDEVDTTITKEDSIKKISNSHDEPIAKKANVSKPSLPKFTLGLDRISEKSSASSNNQDKNERTTRSSSSLINAQSKKYKTNNVIDETTESHNADETIASIYEDATGKPLPIMNSTMNPNCIEGMGKMMSATVVIEPLGKRVINNDTITLMKSPFKEPLSRNNSTIKNTIVERGQNTMTPHAPRPRNAIRVQKDVNDLITDDESSPERKVYTTKKQKILPAQQKRITRSSNASGSDEDEVKKTPEKPMHKNRDFGSTTKSSYKHPVLFSPYAKDSVRKRVEAFEQATGSPINENEVVVRVTRTKTRALAAASFSEVPAQTVSQKLARKSLAKAKKISLAKHAKENDEWKENESANVMKNLKVRDSTEKSSLKPQPKTTPLNKIRVLPQPNSANKNIYSTPNNQPSLNNYSKPLTASRNNVVTYTDSFIQQTKSASKPLDKTAEERRRRAHEEDAKRKREELLRAQADEKRRKREEKELKNKLAREAKEKLEQEKRLKAEREKEEKAKAAQLALEKQREEMEKKRIAQLQRAQEKEEKRRQEELAKQQRQQEQDELVRQLTEQKRREQEMEKRKQAEQKHHFEMKKHQAEKAPLVAKTKALAPKQVPCSYKIDSDPDEEESEDESKPKHQIPSWATRNVRQTQLAMQQYMPMKLVLRYFDAKKCTPDLRELFTGIDPRKLKRSSSAIWKTPPRYSMMNCSIIKD
ncbi:hypothetical protein QAD02_001562 [Eretmocerus hayati]|uniref:Uncharacterized protein n=1 Tax=Eretmocerus hayati TaxID=131215 RepID=A0ACC2NHB6_9HYME|nr:hypothetical protein QAD02_001562 [Eretmocerus hayati]